MIDSTDSKGPLDPGSEGDAPSEPLEVLPPEGADTGLATANGLTSADTALPDPATWGASEEHEQVHGDAVEQSTGKAAIWDELDDPTPEPGPLDKDTAADVVGFEPSVSKTEVGSAFFTRDDAAWPTTNDVPAYPGEYVLDLHGSPESVRVPGMDSTQHDLTASEFAALVKSGTDWSGEPIRLFSCETGQRPDGFAQQLADELGTPVTAPTEAVWTNGGADAIIAKPVQKLIGGVWMTVPGDEHGEWKTFAPNGEATQ